MNSSTTTPCVMTIFIPLVVVFILACLIISLIYFFPVAFLAFSCVIVPLIKGFIVLIPPPLSYTSPAMLNLMKLTFLMSLAPRSNLFPLFICQVSWNRIFAILIHPPTLLHRTFFDPVHLHVIFVLILWMGLCKLVLHL